MFTALCTAVDRCRWNTVFCTRVTARGIAYSEIVFGSTWDRGNAVPSRCNTAPCNAPCKYPMQIPSATQTTLRVAESRLFVSHTVPDAFNAFPPTAVRARPSMLWSAERKTIAYVKPAIYVNAVMMYAHETQTTAGRRREARSAATLR